MNYLKSIALLAIVSLLGSMLRHSIAHTNLAMLYILVVVITAVRWGRGPSLVASILSVLIFDFFFVPPHLSLTVVDTQYLIAFATLFIVGMVISTLTLKAKEQAEAANTREAHTLALYNLNRELVKVAEMKTLLATAINYVNDTFNAEASIFLKESGEARISSGRQQEETSNSSRLESLLNENSAGWSVDAFTGSQVYYIPLKTTKEAFGILGIKFKSAKPPLTPEHYRLIETFANQIAFAVERLNLSEEAQHNELLREAEKLHTAFLNSVSHDLRTPLASISGSLSSILQNDNLDDRTKRSLIETSYEESEKLNQLVGDMLDMARVDAGALHINRKPADIKDLTGAVLKQMENILKYYQVTVNIPDDLPEAEIDFVLIMKVLMNILDNAAKYSSEKREIDITAKIKDNFLEIQIADKGIGIPETDLEHVFDKFYRVKRPQGYKGTGLGLSVCKGIIEAHNGKIRAENRNGGGTRISITLPRKNK